MNELRILLEHRERAREATRRAREAVHQLPPVAVVARRKLEANVRECEAVYDALQAVVDQILLPAP